MVNKEPSSSHKCISKTCAAYCLPPCSSKEFAMKKRKQKSRKNDATIKNFSSYIKDGDLQEAIKLAILEL